MSWVRGSLQELDVEMHESSFSLISSSSSENCAVLNLLSDILKQATNVVLSSLDHVLSAMDCLYVAHLKISEGKALNAKMKLPRKWLGSIRIKLTGCIAQNSSKKPKKAVKVPSGISECVTFK